MAEVPNTKVILALQRLLMEETDENHKPSAKEIIEKLQLELNMTTAIDKRRILRYIEVLSEMGFEVIEDDGKYGRKVFSHQGRLFETYELRMLVDAVLSAKFITEDQAIDMTDKLKNMTSKHLAKSLPSPIKYNKAMSHISNLTKIYINTIHEAIQQSKVIRFKYGKYDIHREFQFQREGRDYYYYPYDTIWDQGYYYLIGQKDNKQGLSNYRVDRMRDVEITDEYFKREDYDIAAYMETTFHMFSGQNEYVEIEFRDHNLINPVIDRFGINANIKVIDENTFVLKTKAIVGRGLHNWLRGWGSRAKVISPPSLVDEMKKELEEMQKLYE